MNETDNPVRRQATFACVLFHRLCLVATALPFQGEECSACIETQRCCVHVLTSSAVRVGWEFSAQKLTNSAIIAPFPSVETCTCKAQWIFSAGECVACPQAGKPLRTYRKMHGNATYNATQSRLAIRPTRGVYIVQLGIVGELAKKNIADPGRPTASSEQPPLKNPMF